jgi:hypothetical protein
MTGFAVFKGDLIMSAASQIRKSVSNYIARRLDLSAFASEFAVLFCDIEDCGEQDAIRLSYSIESELAKHSEGLFDESVLRNSLIACIQADVSQTTTYNHTLVEPIRDEAQNFGPLLSESAPIDALTTA